LRIELTTRFFDGNLENLAAKNIIYAVIRKEQNMISIFIAILALAVGVYVGSLVFGDKEPSEKPAEPKPDSTSPVVDSFIFLKPLTKHTLVEDVLYRECYKFMAHFDIQNRLEIRVSKKYEESINKLADAIMEWYHPESGYTELLLIAHQESSAGFVLDWTWKKPTSGVIDELGR
jgi:hypothetical protein